MSFFLEAYSFAVDPDLYLIIVDRVDLAVIRQGEGAYQFQAKLVQVAVFQPVGINGDLGNLVIAVIAVSGVAVQRILRCDGAAGTMAIVVV